MCCRYEADANLVRRLTAVTTIEQLRTLMRALRDEGTLGKLAPELRQRLLLRRQTEPA